ncbi:MAG: hypothetical protein IPK16_16045 [Anaerolineales bacterium]|nr:hypothetical protein [Anaerolineales bacterium]
MQISYLSNLSLALGSTMLIAFGILWAVGISIDPIVPAIAGFFIGCAAILDRVTTNEIS